MQPGIYSGGGSGNRNLDVPLWYNSSTNLGRGVGNREVTISSNSPSRVQRLGRWFLSTRLANPDSISEGLRLDMKLLASELRNRTVLFTSSPKRSIEGFVDRASMVNGISIGKFVEIKKLKAKKSSR